MPSFHTMPWGLKNIAVLKLPSQNPLLPMPIVCMIFPDMSVTSTLLWFESEIAIMSSDMESLPGNERMDTSLEGFIEIFKGSGDRVLFFACFSSSTSIVSSTISFWPSPDCLYTTVPLGSIITIVGHPDTSYRCQTVMFLSTRTGWEISYLLTACSMFLRSCSLENLAECIPMNTTGMSENFSSSSARTGRVCMQFMQQYVQKSNTTTCPLNFSRERGSFEFIQSKPAGKSGAFVIFE